MSEPIHDAAPSALEDRSRALFRESVDGLDMRVRSRLTQARHAALRAVPSRRPWFFRLPGRTPAAGVTAAAMLGIALWFGTLTGSPGGHGGGDQPNLEDLEMVASGDGGSDAMEMLQDDLDFYDFADNATNSGPTA